MLIINKQIFVINFLWGNVLFKLMYYVELFDFPMELHTHFREIIMIEV